MSKTLQMKTLPGYEPEIGRWLWALEEVRHRTLDSVEGLDQETLDWEGPQGSENAIGSLLYHIAIVEMYWLYFDVLRTELPSAVKTLLPIEMGTEGRLTNVPAIPLAEHLERLHRTREMFLTNFHDMSRSDWEQLRSPKDMDYRVTPAWAVFHLVEHEAGHAAQIGSLKARAARAKPNETKS